MHTSEIAGAGDVPHGDGFARASSDGHATRGSGCMIGGMPGGVAVAEAVGRLGDAGPEFGEIDHESGVMGWNERRALGI